MNFLSFFLKKNLWSVIKLHKLKLSAKFTVLFKHIAVEPIIRGTKYTITG